MPKPKEDESKEEWLERCMSDGESVNDFPDEDQRFAFCQSRWKEHTENDSEKRMKHAYVKAVLDGDEWTLEVLAAPFGAPDDKDSQGEYFTPQTKFHDDKYGLPPVVYYHGFSPDGKPMGEPQYIGKAIDREVRPDGIWYKVVLDKAKDFAHRVWQAAKEKVGGAVASSGSLPHLVRVENDGRIREWAINELSLWDFAENRQPANRYAVALPQMKTIYKAAGLDFPEGEAERGDTTAEPGKKDDDRQQDKTYKSQGAFKMDEKEKQRLIEEAKREERERIKAEQEAERERQEELEQAKEEAIKTAREKWEKEQKEKEEELEKQATKARRLPEDSDGAPYLAQFGELAKYDNLSPEDQAVLVGVLNATDGGSGIKHRRASEEAIKALAIKLQEATKSEDISTRRLGIVGNNALKAAMPEGEAIKADEIMQQDLTSYGDEWVGVAYSQAIWEAIRANTFVASNLPSVEIPPGHESLSIPLESGDPTFYKVAEATDTATSGWPNATITSSKVGTDSSTISLSKMGARVLWSGEMEEDSLIPFVSQLRSQLEKAGAEQLEHAIIDGDIATTATTNINDIGNASAQGGTELYLLFNGFRKSPLVTTTANSRDGGALVVEDYLETLKLMGTAGLNAQDKSKIGFIVDPNTYWKSFELEEVKTKDVRVQPVLEDGELTSLYGVSLNPSWFMHYKSSDRLANTSGKVDQDTTANNTTGSILGVRWDQWLLGYRRRMTMETTRIARADTTEIVALMRLGLTQRDTEAAAISYNITV